MSRKRLFFSLMPEEEVRNQIVEIAKRFPVVQGMRPVSSNNLHVTLLFLGNVEDKDRKCLENKILHICSRPFTLRLDEYGHFKHPQSIWLGCSFCPDELNSLVERLKSSGVQCSLDFDDRPYKPHVTLFRKARRVNFPDEPVAIDWNVSEFHLVESVSHENTTRYNKIVSCRLIDEQGS